jgi:twitching motility protein PilT
MAKVFVMNDSVEYLLQDLLSQCVQRHASDLHLVPDESPALRIEGLLVKLERPALSGGHVDALAQHLLAVSGAVGLDQKGSADGAFSGPCEEKGKGEGARFRFSVFRRQGHLAVAIRRLEDRIRNLGELGMPESLYQLADLRDGLVVVCGPTGSGKSTTLAALIDRINRTRAAHIITLEDPVEYLHRPARCLVNQRQIGADAPSFNDALVASLRQDPDVILVGEIRDLATIRTAITAAETGHLVFTTVHAGDCAGTIERLVAVFPAEEQEAVRRQLAMVLRAVVSQHLLSTVEQESSPHDAGTGRTMSAGIPAGLSQERRRVVATEIMLGTPAISNLIATGKPAQIYSVMESGQAAGMQTLEQDLARLCVKGLISEATATAMARNVQVLHDRLDVARRKRFGGHGMADHKAKGGGGRG